MWKGRSCEGRRQTVEEHKVDVSLKEIEQTRQEKLWPVRCQRRCQQVLLVA